MGLPGCNRHLPHLRMQDVERNTGPEDLRGSRTSGSGPDLRRRPCTWAGPRGLAREWWWCSKDTSKVPARYNGFFW